jgi:hypothetical protein
MKRIKKATKRLGHVRAQQMSIADNPQVIWSIEGKE